ncbi:hypothetical protein AU509_09190 [Lonsdalea britannica]|uniref:Uncharacterized protein n=1 Tax=Lonsdalea britannica TaxID=1082704 RepID=A0AAD0SN72_9GAMM|nr:hypothetical protein CKQ53_15820 [Lonsdalea britannica]OSM97287.1 hypothetical protein AU509_09190 [Lonsdalea britannica]OSN08406.1 hypothetical protein AU510_04575 [Lonsdalea britannica]
MIHDGYMIDTPGTFLRTAFDTKPPNTHKNTQPYSIDSSLHLGQPAKRPQEFGNKGVKMRLK